MATLEMYTVHPDSATDDHKIVRELGTGTGPGSATSFSINIGKDFVASDLQVRRYSSETYVYGLPLALDTNASVDAGEFDYDSGTGDVTIMPEDANTDTYVVMTKGKMLFEDQYAKISSATDADRTLAQRIFFKATGGNFNEVSIDFGNYVADGYNSGNIDAGSDLFEISFVDSATVPGASDTDAAGTSWQANDFSSDATTKAQILDYTTDTTYSSGDTGTIYDSGTSTYTLRSMWVKALIPQVSNVENYRNIYLNVNSIETSSH